jgi:hypothetical protein
MVAVRSRTCSARNRVRLLRVARCSFKGESGSRAWVAKKRAIYSASMRSVFAVLRLRLAKLSRPEGIEQDHRILVLHQKGNECQMIVRGFPPGQG